MLRRWVVAVVVWGGSVERSGVFFRGAGAGEGEGVVCSIPKDHRREVAFPDWPRARERNMIVVLHGVV